MSRQSWQAAIGEISNLIENEPNRENALLLAALYVIQERIVGEDKAEVYQVGIPAIEPFSASQDYPVDDIEGELGDAEKYLKRYVDIMDADYLQMAFDESTHALKFIKALPDGEMKREYMVRHDGIVERIRAYGMAI